MPTSSACSLSSSVSDVCSARFSNAPRTWVLAEPDLFAVIRFRGLPIRCLLLRACETSSLPRGKKNSHRLTLGATARAHAPVDLSRFGDGVAGDWDLLAAEGGGFRLCVPGGAELWWSAHENARVQAMNVDSVPPVLRLGEAGCLTLALGDIAVELRRAERGSIGRIPARGVLDAFDLGELTGHGASALLVLAWLAVFRFMPPDSDALSFDLEAGPREGRRCLVIPAVPPAAAASAQSKAREGGGAPEETSARPRRRDRAGSGKTALASVSSAPPSREAAPEIRNLGLLKVLNADRGAWSRVADGASLGEDAAAVLNDLRGTSLAGPYSAGGFEGPGTGSGPAGTGDGLAGGGDGLLAIAGGVRDRHGRDLGLPGPTLGWARKRNVVPEVVTGPTQVQGSLDKEIIRRIIRRHINEVHYCYQQSLQRKPSLGGRIVLSFLILPQGTTTAVTPANDTVGDPALASCLVQAGRRWLYPAPQGGGIVKVSFPFVFTPAGVTE